MGLLLRLTALVLKEHLGGIREAEVLPAVSHTEGINVEESGIAPCCLVESLRFKLLQG